jgi:Tol biopolymer transport system component
LAAIDVETGEVKWVDHGQQKREVQLGLPVWSEDGTKAVIVGRAVDNKDRWIFALDPATGKTRVLANQHDDAWVDGPGATPSAG